MVYGFRIFRHRISPCLNHFKHEKIIFVNHTGICDPALQVGKTCFNERRFDKRCRHRPEAESFKFISIPAGSISNENDFLRQLHAWYGNNTFPCRFEDIECVIAVADNTSYKRRLEIQHGMPGHGHHIIPTPARRRQQNDRPGFKQSINPGQGKGFSFHGSSFTGKSAIRC
jgi:hypothetical protein